MMDFLISALLLLYTINTHSHAQSINTVPGTFLTKSGYDTEMGSDTICWETEGITISNNISDIELQNDLVSNFFISSLIELKSECHGGMNLSGYVPDFVMQGKGILRTEKDYVYRVVVNLNITELKGNKIISDKHENPVFQTQIVLCKTGIVGFCSPYVHEQANDRLAALNITEELESGDEHGGTHVHAYGDMTTVSLSKSNGRSSQRFEVDIPVRVNDPGNFFAIAAVQFFMGNATNLFKYDMANALNNRLLAYEAPPDKLLVGKGVSLAIMIVIIVAAAAIIYLLLCTIKQRNESVMQLCQVHFLVVFLIAALIATGGSFLLNPKNDTHCNVQGILIFIPLQVMYAITIGRLWRIRAVISPHIKKTKLKERSISGFIFNFLTWFSSVNLSTCGRSSLQQMTLRPISISDSQLTKVVSLFTFPMVIIQVLRVLLEPKILDFKFNDDESVGRAYCKSPNSDYGLLEIISAALLLSIFVFLLFMAYSSRELPSFLNETKQIYKAALITVLVIAIGTFVIMITYAPSTSPDAQYALSAFMVLCVTLNMSFGLMYPKLKMIWSGEKVVISTLMTDAVTTDETQALRPVDWNGSMIEDSFSGGRKQQYEDAANLRSQNEEGKLSNKKNEASGSNQMNVTNPENRHMWVMEGEAPPKNLVLRMVGVNDVINYLTQQITSGREVSKEDWENFREMSSDLSEVLNSRVKFDWEQAEL